MGCGDLQLHGLLTTKLNLFGVLDWAQSHPINCSISDHYCFGRAVLALQLIVCLLPHAVVSCQVFLVFVSTCVPFFCWVCLFVCLFVLFCSDFRGCCCPCSCFSLQILWCGRCCLYFYCLGFSVVFFCCFVAVCFGFVCCCWFFFGGTGFRSQKLVFFRNNEMQIC